MLSTVTVGSSCFVMTRFCCLVLSGMDSFTTESETKRLGLLKELLPKMKRMAFLGDFRNSAVQKQWNEVESAARPLNLHASRLDIRSALDVSRAFDAAMKEKVDAIRVPATSWPSTSRKKTERPDAPRRLAEHCLNLWGYPRLPQPKLMFEVPSAHSHGADL